MAKVCHYSEDANYCGIEAYNSSDWRAAFLYVKELNCPVNEN